MAYDRFRRLRNHEGIRSLVRETQLLSSDLVAPVFVTEQQSEKTAITQLPGCFRYGFDQVFDYTERLLKQGVHGIALFPVINEAKKDKLATYCLDETGLMPKMIKALKKRFPEVVIFADVALDPYSSDGHDGIVKNDKILNDATVDLLVKMSLLFAQAGADFVAPSDMMDGRVQAIRNALESAGFPDTGMMSYAVKYASVFYGPFRDALQSAPKKGDKKSYQMDPANTREAIKEALQDVKEGADILMVKPAGMYADIIFQIKQKVSCPVAAYHVSGEYAMLYFAAEKGCFDFNQAIMEKTLCLKRAGADIIFSYAALQLAKILNA